VGNRTALVNQVRGLLSERGIIIPQGINKANNKAFYKPCIEQYNFMP
jgi:hypothetical protein